MTTVAVRDRKAALPDASTLTVPETGSGSITALLHLAVQKGTPVAELRELVALHEHMSQRQAAQDFAAAMAAFQAECPSIRKSSAAKITTRGGGTYDYTYAELDEIARTVNPILAKNGLSYTWDTQADDKMLTTVCTVRHANGHSITSSFVVPVESASAMSAQQKYASAATFAQRKSLSAALGLTTTDDDTDGVSPETITEDQAIVLADLVKETQTNLARFCKWLDVDTLEQVRAADYQRAKSTLERKKAGTV